MSLFTNDVNCTIKAVECLQFKLLIYAHCIGSFHLNLNKSSEATFAICVNFNFDAVHLSGCKYLV